MKLNKITAALVALLLIPTLAWASGQELSWQKLQQLQTLAAGSIASGDYIPVYDASAGIVKKVDATAYPSPGGAFNGTVGATTPAAGTFTALKATTSLDLAPAYSTSIIANPVSMTAYGTCTVAAVNGGTCIPLAAVTGRTITVTFFDIVAAGSAATCTGVKLEDTNGTPVVVATLAAATLTSGSHNIPLTATLGVGFGAGTGLTASKGVQILVNGSACTTTTAFTYAITYSIQ